MKVFKLVKIEIRFRSLKEVLPTYLPRISFTSTLRAAPTFHVWCRTPPSKASRCNIAPKKGPSVFGDAEVSNQRLRAIADI